LIVQFIISGALVGFVVGVTGVGGGSLMTPLLTLVFGVPAQVAVGTDLLFAAVTKSGGAISYARQSNIPWSIVRRLALGSIPASVATLVVLRVLPPDTASLGSILKPALGVALFLTAGALAFRERIAGLGRRLALEERGLVAAGAAGAGANWEIGGDASGIRTVATGALIGILVTLTSVGAGAIGVVALFFLYPGLAAQKLVGADIVHAVPLTLVAGLGHAALGTVDWRMLAGLLIGSLPAIHLGAAVASRLPERVLRFVLAGILTLVGARLVAG